MVIPKNQYLKQFIHANHKRVGGKTYIVSLNSK